MDFLQIGLSGHFRELISRTLQYPLVKVLQVRTTKEFEKTIQSKAFFKVKPEISVF